MRASCLPNRHFAATASSDPTQNSDGSYQPVRWADASSLLLVLGDAVHAGDPVARRAVPVLLLWHQLVALRQDADPDHVGRLLAFARRGRIDRRAAGAAERLHPWPAAVGGGLDVIGRLALHLEDVARDRHRNAERRAGAGLAVGAVANPDLLRVRFAFDGNRAAVARASDPHGNVLLIA